MNVGYNCAMSEMEIISYFKVYAGDRCNYILDENGNTIRLSGRPDDMGIPASQVDPSSC